MAKGTSQSNHIFLKRVGARIRESRKRMRLSQEALALASGLDRSYLGGVERGERNIAVVNLHKIATTLNVPLSELLEKL
jgi:transcriptional regulator with XRE-family HTH domain